MKKHTTVIPTAGLPHTSAANIGSLEYFALVQRLGRIFLTVDELPAIFGESTGLVRSCREVGWLTPTIRSVNDNNLFSIPSVLRCAAGIREHGHPKSDLPLPKLSVDTLWIHSAFLFCFRGKLFFRPRELPEFFLSKQQIIDDCIAARWLVPAVRKRRRLTLYALSGIVDCCIRICREGPPSAPSTPR